MSIMSIPKLLLAATAMIAAVDASSANKKATDINMGSIYKAKPALRTATPVRSRAFNRPSFAAVVVSKLSARKPKTPTTKTTTKKTVKKTTKKKTTTQKSRTTKKTTPKKKKTTKKTTTKKKAVARKPVKKIVNNRIKRDDDCSGSVVNTVPNTYTPSDNTPSGFLLDATIDATASAAWYPPTGYTLSTLDLWNATVDNSYIQYLYLPSYNVSTCAAACDSRADCLAFNIFYERTPAFIPDALCLNPAAYAGITCSLYSSRITQASSTNIGQWKQNFLVTIAGSNAFIRNLVPSRRPGYTAPTAQPGALDGTSVFSSFSTTYAPDDCAQTCSNFTSAAHAQAVSNNASTYIPCNYYNIFNVTYNQVFQGMYCSLFSTPPSTNASFATYLQGNGGTSFNVTGSFSAALYPQNSGQTNKTYTAGPTGAGASCKALGQTSYDDFTLACGFDMPAADLARTTGADFFSCLDQCKTYANCSAVSYDGQFCYFKNPDSTRIPSKHDGVDLAFLSSAYSPPTSAARAVITSATVAWSGASTTVVTSYSDLTAWILTKTPGSGATSSVPTSYIDSGSASTISVLTAGGTVSSIFPTPTCNSQGASFAFFSLASTGSIDQYNPNDYDNVAPQATGVSDYVGIYAPEDEPVQTIYGRSSVNTSELVVTQTFYLYAGRGTGFHYFQIPSADGIEFLWTGPSALGGWAASNAVQVSTPNSDQQLWAVFLTFGTYFPFRVNWANADAAASLTLSIGAPDGSSILASSTTGSNDGTLTDNIVAVACDGSSSFPPWPAFA